MHDRHPWAAGRPHNARAMPLGTLLLSVVLALALTGCGADSTPKPKPRARAPHLVELAEAKPGRLAYSPNRAGSLRALREVKIVNEEEGRLTEISVREGDRVAAGAVVVRYDDGILRAQLDKAAATRKQAEVDLQRNRQMKSKGFISDDAVSRAATVYEVARAEERLLATRLQSMTIAAPFDGVVARRLVDPGNATPRHTHLLTIIDPSQLVTDVTVSELIMPELSVGGAAQVRIDALGEQTYKGEIARIHPAIDPLTRTGLVEVALNPVPPGARAGQFCRVTLETAIREQLIVPLSALQRDPQGEYVFVYGKAVAQGPRAGDGRTGAPGAKAAAGKTAAEGGAKDGVRGGRGAESGTVRRVAAANAS